MSDSVALLEEMRGKLDAKRARLKSQLVAVETEFQEIDTALRVLQRLSATGPATASAIPSDNGAIILKFVGVGEDEARPPKDIFDALQQAGHDLNADLVRTQLWRMAKRGLLESENGKYWRVLGSEFGSLLGKEHPDSPATEQDFRVAFGDDVPPNTGGFMRVPEDDLDDDVPF